MFKVPAGQFISNVLRIALCALLLIPVCAVQAQDYPTKTVRMVVPFSPGTTSDILGRLIAAKLSTELGHQVIVENKPGAGGTIGYGAVAKASPDGYTLLLAGDALALGPLLYRKLPYDPAKDFAPVTMVALVPNMLVVNRDLPVKSIGDLIKYAKANPGKLNYASSGKGSGSYRGMELFKAMAGVDIVEIPYKSSAQALTDAMSGQVAINYPSLAAVLPLVNSGRIRALAVSGAKRSAAAPEVPAMGEILPGYDANGSYGLFFPAGTPSEIVSRIHDDVVKILKMPDIRENLARQGAEPVGSKPQELSDYMSKAAEKWKKLFAKLSINPQ
jgi:tripartite-type tricarboxylate transporter receptor subunit TctC